MEGEGEEAKEGRKEQEGRRERSWRRRHKGILFQKDPGLSRKRINVNQYALSLSPTPGPEQGPEVKQRDSNTGGFQSRRGQGPKSVQ